MRIGKTLRSLAWKSMVRIGNTFGIKRLRREKPAEELLVPLDPAFREPLLSMYRGEPQLGVDGQTHQINNYTRISPSQGMWQYDFCLSTKPRSLIEIGLAYGFSTIYFLAAIARNGHGHHTAVDPFQRSRWHGIGLAHAQALGSVAGLGSTFRHIEDRSDRVATDLVRAHSTFELIFIDGDHRFDAVLVDFFQYARLCAMGGHIIFDDMWLRSVQTVTAFVRSNRSDFAEVRTAQPNVAVFQRVGDDSRNWDHFNEF